MHSTVIISLVQIGDEEKQNARILDMYSTYLPSHFGSYLDQH